MSRAVRFRPAAERDLVRLSNFIADDNFEAAERLSRTLRDAAHSVRERAERGRPLHDSLRELVVPFGRSRYVLRYLMRDDSVTITRIWNSRERR